MKIFTDDCNPGNEMLKINHLSSDI